MHTTTPSAPTAPTSNKRFGYAVAVGVNAALLWVVLNIQSWDLLPFLTDRFSEVVPWVAVSLVVSMLANLAYQVDDSPTVHAFGDLATSLIGAWAAYRMLVVFPFEFSGGGFDGSTVIRVLLIIAIVGGGIGAFTALVRLVAART